MALSDIQDESEARDFKDAITGQLTTQNFNKTQGTQATYTWTQGPEDLPGLATVPSVSGAVLCAVLVKPGVSPTASNNELADYRYPIGQSKEYSFAPFQIGRRFVNPTGNPSATFREEGVMGLQVNVRSGEEAELYTKCPSVGYNHRLGFLFVSQTNFLAPGAAPLVEERLISNVDETLAPFFAGYRIRYTHTSSLPLWGNGYHAGVAAANEGLEPVGIVWKCKVDFEPAGSTSQSYVLNNMVWKVFGE